MYDDFEEMANSETCEYSVVYVSEDPNFKSTGNVKKFCNATDVALPVIKSKSNMLYVRFVSDYSSEERFVAEVSFTYGKLKCFLNF